MTPEYTNQLATELLLSGLISVLALAIMAGVLTLLFVRQKRASKPGLVTDPDSSVAGSRGYHASVFDSPCRWIAIKKRHVRTVQTALGLHNPVPCSWDEGMSQVNAHKLFVSPPVRGWILVIGPGLPDPSEDVDRCFHFLMRLSRTLGQVQFFSSNRALNHHAWVDAQSGRIRRAYAWAGEALWNQGPLTPAEVDLHLICHAYGERPVPELSTGASQPSNAEKVTQLAARWSLDPTAVEERMLRLGLGVTGDVTFSQRS